MPLQITRIRFCLPDMRESLSAYARQTHHLREVSRGHYCPARSFAGPPRWHIRFRVPVTHRESTTPRGLGLFPGWYRPWLLIQSVGFTRILGTASLCLLVDHLSFGNLQSHARACVPCWLAAYLVAFLQTSPLWVTGDPMDLADRTHINAHKI